MQKYAYLGLGWVCLGMAALGFVLPLLPGTVFIILAAFFFSRGSPRMRAWLLANRTFGPAIQRWEAEGAIPVKAKVIACATMGITVFASYLLGVRPMILGIQAVLILSAATYILSRPS